MEQIARRPPTHRARPRSRRARGRLVPDPGRWRVGVLVTIAVSVPPLVVEEGVHARAMIDKGLLWIPFAVVVTLGFLAGGAIAASSRSGRARPALAALLGASCGFVAIAALVCCDLVRRFAIVHEGLSTGVVDLWIVAGTGAVALSGVGAAATSALVRARELRTGRPRR